MITFTNGHSFEYMVASGALGFDGKGWFWERVLVWLGLIKPELFTIVLKTLTKQSVKGNLNWGRPWTWIPFSPWSCVRLISGGAVNKVGLTNSGIDYWCTEIAPYIDFKKMRIIVSIYGTPPELGEMVVRLNGYELVGIEINVSCPNSGDALEEAREIVHAVKAVEGFSRHPIIVKVSVKQDYLAIARELVGVAEAISLNSVPYEIAFSDGTRSPVWRLEKKLGGGGGGVSGIPAQRFNWPAVEKLAEQGALPVIAPSVMEFADLAQVRALGAEAVSFGAIHLRTPWRPTRIVELEQAVAKEAARTYGSSYP